MNNIENFNEINQMENVHGHIEENFNEIDIEDGDDWLETDEGEANDLHISKRFISWQEVTLFLNDYCMQKGFGYRKGRSKKKNGDEDAVKRTFLCKHAGIFKSNKTANLMNREIEVLAKLIVYVMSILIKKERGFMR